jgi:hypothetical protein
LLYQAFLGAHSPAPHGGVPQTAHRFDQKPFDLVGPFHRTIRMASDLQDRLKPLHQIRMLAQLLDELLVQCV